MIKTKVASKLALVFLGFGVGTQIPTHQTYAPTMKDVVEILADYDVRHIDAVPGVPFYGATDMDNHTIFIVNNQDFIFKRRTVIHELAHVKLRLMGEKDMDEDVTNAVEEAVYKKLFVDGDGK